MPEELLLTTPPMVAADSLAGSGPNLRPYSAKRALTCATVSPGSTRTTRPCSSTAMLRKPRRTSTSKPSPDACPDKDVPPERKVTGRLCCLATRKACATSYTSEATITALGKIGRASCRERVKLAVCEGAVRDNRQLRLQRGLRKRVE